MFKNILIVLLSFLFGINTSQAQRCGYDYLQAFVVRIVDHNHTNNIANLKLTLANEFGEKLKYPVNKANSIEENHIPEEPRLHVPYLKKNSSAEFMEFWENKNTHGLSSPALNTPAHLKLDDDLYVIFVGFPYSNNRKVDLPVYQLIVEDPDSVSHFKQFPSRKYRLDPEKAVYLCANHLVGEGDAIKNKNINFIDGSRFEPIQFDLSNHNVHFTGKVQKPRYVKVVLKDAYPNTSQYPDRLVNIEEIGIYDGSNLQLVQKIIPNSFAKVTKKSNQLTDFKWFYEKQFPVNMKLEFVNEFVVKQGSRNIEMLSILMQKGNSFSGVPYNHKLYFHFDTSNNQYLLDTPLSEYPNVQIQNAYHERSRYEIYDTPDECKLRYYILEGQKWRFQNENILRTKNVQKANNRSVLDDIRLAGYNQDGVKKFYAKVGQQIQDTILIHNKGKIALNLSVLKFTQNNNPYICQINKVDLPKLLMPNETIPILLKFNVIKNLKLNDGSLPFERIYAKLELNINEEKLSLDMNYLIINQERIKSATKPKNEEDVKDTVFFEPFMGAGYQLITLNNEINAYGKWVQLGDSIRKTGFWNYSNPRKMVEYDREFTFLVQSKKGEVDSQLVINSIQRGKSIKLYYLKTPQGFRVWLPKSIDTIEFQWQSEWNQVSRFNNEIHENQYWVNLINRNSQYVYPVRYQQFTTQQSMNFVSNSYLIQLNYTDMKEMENERNEFMESNIGLNFSIDARYPSNILLVEFDKIYPNEKLNYLNRWEFSNQVKSIHQKVVQHGNAETYLGNHITVKPRTGVWNEIMNGDFKKLGFEMIQNFGDGNYYLSGISKLADEKLFLRMLTIIQDSKLMTANPEFFNPILPKMDHKLNR